MAVVWGTGEVNIVNITANMGYIQTTEPALLQKLSWVKLTVPLNHVTLLSFLFMELAPYLTGRTCPLYNMYQLYDDVTENIFWTACAYRFPSAGIYTARVLHLIRYRRKRGFWRAKILYSVHEQSHQPSRVTGGLWNCSVHHWPEFERHFRCNLEKECEAGEDESQCFYTGHCGEGFLTLNNRCYKYVDLTSSSRTPWLDTRSDCRQRGGYLVSLNTPGEWQAVEAALKARRHNKMVFVGLCESPSAWPVMYRQTYIWTDTTVAYFSKIHKDLHTNCAAFLDGKYDLIKVKIYCTTNIESWSYLCEMDSMSRNIGKNAENNSIILTSLPENESLAVPSVKCPAGHLTHDFLACDDQSVCWSGQQHGRAEGKPSDSSLRGFCLAPMTSHPEMFTCGTGLQRVSYSMTCDHRQQCTDGSDESFCVFPPCSGSTPMQCAASEQVSYSDQDTTGHSFLAEMGVEWLQTSCVARSAICNGVGDCRNKADEHHCEPSDNKEARRTLPPPATVYFTPMSPTHTLHDPFVTKNLSQTSSLTANKSPCPETHFQCLDNGYCLPVFVRCNGVNDCPGHEDEAGCDSALCPGFYRCRSSGVCLHPSHVCDGVYQCPEQDDELFCRLACPENCTCYGLAFTCPQSFRAELHPQLRYLDASGSGLTPEKLKEKIYLIHLSLMRCGVKTLHNITFPNLRNLDVSHNNISTISQHHFCGLLNLQHLSLSYNPLKSLFSEDTGQFSFPAMRTLDFSGIKMPALNSTILIPFPGLQMLNLSHCDVDHVADGTLRVVSQLRAIDAAGCPLTQFPGDLLSGLLQLQHVWSDNFKLCCPQILPAGFYLANCMAPSNELSSCDSLLRLDVYRIFISVFSSLSLLGNLSCLLVRTFILKSNKSGFGVFVTYLSISDFLMGMYLAVIGVADHLYRGSYLWKDTSWRHSVFCTMAGFVSLLSNETSAFMIVLITLDRFLVLRFPFSNVHFKARSARITCAGVCFVVLMMASFPLMSHWSFYSQTGICIPLPVTAVDFVGRQFAFGVFIVLNLILFLLIAVGQAAVYLSIQANSLSVAESTKKSADLRIARRLITVAVSDFLCWFPIGLLGLLASRGVPIPGEINVGLAVMVLPLNSALNPFLYTVNIMLGKRMKARDQQLLQRLMIEASEDQEKPT